MASGNTLRFRAILDDKVSSGLTKIHDNFNRLGKNKGAQAVLQGVGVGAGISAYGLLSSAIGSVVDVVGSSIRAASAMSESLGKTRVVFADNADEIEAWSKTAAKSFGLSTQAALEAAGTYGNLFQAFGVGRVEATKMSKTLVELAADLASFNNTSIDDALIALRSGLSGETEPLKRYGIAISDARMRTELMSQGVKKLGATLTPLQKSQAAYGLILKDSTLAQGDFARTSDGLANTQRSLDAAMADVSAELGEKLIPLVLDLAHFAKDVLVPAFGGVVDLLENTRKEFGQVALAGHAVHDFFADLLYPISETRDAIEDWAGTATEAMDDVGHAGIFMGGDVGGSSKVAATAITTVAVSAEKTRTRVDVALGQIVADFRKRKGEMQQVATDAGEALYGAIDARADLSAINREQAEIRAKIASGTLRGADLADAQQKLRDLQRTELELITGLAAHGQASAKEVSDTIGLLVKSLKGKTQAEQIEIMKLIALLGQVNALGGGGHAGESRGRGGRRPAGRAHGGPVEEDVPVWVGENRQRELFVPRSDGHVFTQRQAESRFGGSPAIDSRGAPVVIQIPFDGKVLAQIVEPRLSYSQRSQPR